MYIFRFIRSYIANRSYQKALDNAYQQDSIIAKLSNMFGVQFRRDWIGRLYAVINPAIRDGKFDRSQAFEYAEDGVNTTEHAKVWMMQRLTLLQGFIQAENLFDLLTYDIKRIDDSGNYLLTILPITLHGVLSGVKSAIIELLILAGVAGGICWWLL
jgi:hypothetical protein